METRFVVTPWRNSEELLQVRQDLYGSSGADSIERRQKAVHKILTWRIRQPEIPLLLDSTADIVDAVLQDEGGGLRHNALRLVYATAISRFITGFTDTKSDLLSSRPPWLPKPLTPDTPILSLPSTLLETRHSIVHRDLPSLSDLRKAARQSLDWLWEWYWSQLDRAFGLAGTGAGAGEGEGAGGTIGGGEADPDTFADSLTTILKLHVKRRKEEITSNLKTISQIARQKARIEAQDQENGSYTKSTSTSTDITPAAIFSHSHNSLYGTNLVIKALVSVLVDDKLILPSKVKSGDSMAGAYMIWDPILLELGLQTRGSAWAESRFLPQLLDRIIHLINARSGSNTKDLGEDEPIKEAMHAWLQHILTSSDFENVRREQRLVEAVLERCFTEPTGWNLRIAEGLLEGDAVRDKGLWEQVLRAARDEGMDIDVDEGARNEGSEDRPKNLVKDVQGQNEVKQKWSGPRKKLGLWRPTPIGAVPIGWEDALG